MPLSSLSPLHPGTIVEYIQNNQTVMGCVQELRAARVKLVNINQREMKLPLARILPWTGPSLPEASSRSDILQTMKALEAQRQELGRDIDPMELWELAQGEISQASIAWLAGLLWEDPGANEKAALGRKLLATKTHFKFSPPHFEIYSQETVTRRTEEMRRTQERERLVAEGQAFFKQLWKVHQNSAVLSTTPDAETARQLRQILIDRIGLREHGETEAVWKKMTAGIPDIPFLALHLAQAWGIVPPHYNYLLDQAGYEWEDEIWSAPFARDIDNLRARVLTMAQPVTHTRAVSIDSASTRDIDDGFFIERTKDGFHLEIVLACPGLAWEFGSSLDKAVMERFSSIYLPEGTANMLPRDLGNDFFSLHAGKDRPALLFEIHLDHLGNPLACRPRHQWVRLQHNLTYDEVQENLVSDHPDPMLQAADELAQMLRTNRIQQGAVIMQQPDPRIMLNHTHEDVEVVMEPGPPENRAQVLVSEFMILANSQAALWAMDHDIPLIFRTQNISLPKESAGIWSAPCDIFRLIKCMGPSIMEATPKRHAALGVDAYAPITSPLRRYADFINSAQILAALTSDQFPWTSESIKAVLPRISARAQAVGRIQRFRPRYWKYLFFRQQAKQRNWTGEVVEHNERMVTLALTQEQLFLRAPTSLFGDKVRLGQRFTIRLGKVDPLNNELHIAEAWEA
ncbi:ribonuclease catalytic domain-containing protein [Desulfoplanes formicivorans]|uniref:Ribonuclease II n=1 Tax=Desulfoplanes formicivorans TaxID=1592317 RepID=A0A194AID3_9BACT|nr:ribonuclease catalytic domain-containing protein [Desulfoplanes formicivorans]GAU08831.1 ribonuclease II [Desulfoplanes formicivorans]